MSNELEGKVAVVTGAASGMGLAAAELFAKCGASVVVADVNEQASLDVAASIQADGAESTGFRADVSHSGDVETLFERVRSHYGRLDVLYNNAGLWLPGLAGYVVGETDGPSPLLTEDIWDRTINVSLKGTYLCCRFGIPLMKLGSGGSIINVSSVVAVRAGDGATDAYTAAKGGILSMTRSLAVEHAQYGIRVNCIVPGAIQTAMSAQVPSEIRDAFAALIPLQRWGTASEVARMAKFLASDDSSYCTGQTFVVDGGFSAK